MFAFLCIVWGAFWGHDDTDKIWNMDKIQALLHLVVGIVMVGLDGTGYDIEMHLITDQEGRLGTLCYVMLCYDCEQARLSVCGGLQCGGLKGWGREEGREGWGREGKRAFVSRYAVCLLGIYVDK